MFVEDNLLTSALWFFMGAIGYRGLSALLFYSKTALIIQRTYIFALDVLWMANESYNASIEFKHEMAEPERHRRDGCPQGKRIRRRITETLAVFCHQLINYYVPTLKYRSSLEFKDWHTAMNFRTRTKRQ